MSDAGSRAARLATILFLIALLTSRLSLIAHELGGHAAPAVAMGGTLDDWHLFLFAGGYVDVDRAEPWTEAENLIIALGGIALELVAGGLLLLVAARMRRGGLARFAVLAFAVIDLLHAGYYLCAGTFHGYGDGIALHRALGDARAWLLVPGTALLLGGALLAGRAAIGALRDWLAPLSRGAQAGVIAAGLVVAAAGHGALTLAELRLAARATYTSTMRHESDRRVDREVAIAVARQRARGTPPPPAEIERLRADLRERHRRFPYAVVLAIALALAFAAGGLLRRRSPAPGSAAPTWPAIGRLAVVTGGAVLLVAVLRLLE